MYWRFFLNIISTQLLLFVAKKKKKNKRIEIFFKQNILISWPSFVAKITKIKEYIFLTQCEYRDYKRGNLITLSFSYQVFFFQDDHSLILWWLRAWGRLFMGAILCLLLNPKFFRTSAPAYEPPFFQKDFVKRPKFFLRFSLVVARNFVCEFPEHWWKEERHARRCQSVGSFRLFSSFS